jgi:hypothetical protein
MRLITSSISWVPQLPGLWKWCMRLFSKVLINCSRGSLYEYAYSRFVMEHGKSSLPQATRSLLRFIRSNCEYVRIKDQDLVKMTSYNNKSNTVAGG